MPTTRETVLAALLARLQPLAALTLRDEVLPERIPAAGLIILRDGQPGEPEVTLSPLCFHYQHQAELEVVVQAPKQEMVGAIDAVCDVAQRIIGKLVDGPPGGVSPLADFATDSGGGGRPPTAAMKRYADSIARQKGIKLPTGHTKSGSVCRAFLEQHAPKKAEGAGENTGDGLGARPPSPAQLSFAESISREQGVAITDEAKANSAAMFAWIDKNQGSNPGKGRRKTIAKNSKPAATKSTKLTKRPKKPEASVVMADATCPPVAVKRDTSANTPLRIPYGNKEAAQKLGARYAEGGWYAPPGVDLTEFKSNGWL